MVLGNGEHPSRPLFIDDADDVLTKPGIVKTLCAPACYKFTINRMTSRGVKCSPAVSFDSSENLRISSS
jgi:hypothetical protein